MESGRKDIVSWKSKSTDYEELLDSDIAFSKTAFELKVKSVLWFVVHGSQLVMVFWFRKSAVFYLPPGWFGPAQRFLSWPFAPAGKIGKI